MLRECVDEGLARQILAAQDEAARRTHGALRDCITAAVRALEAEARACGLSVPPAASGDEAARRRLCATLAHVRQTPHPPGVPATRAASPPTGMVSRAGSPPVGRAASPPSAGGAAWSSFVERQAAAERRRPGSAGAGGGGKGQAATRSAREGSSVTPESPTPADGRHALSTRSV